MLAVRPTPEDPRLARRAAHGVGRGFIVARAVATAAGAKTVVASARAGSPLRLLEPAFAGARCAAVCMVTFGGGLVDGDRIELDVEVEAGATLLLFTQSSTKVFRGASAQHLAARVAGTLVLLPDPVSAFAGARYTGRVDVALEGRGACVVLDAITSGRPAYGDRWAMTGLDLRTRVSLDGRAVVTDALRLGGGAPLARMGHFEALATLLAVGGAAGPIVTALLAEPIAPPTRDLVVAASRLPRASALGTIGAVARIAATSPSLALDAARRRLRNLPDIDVVDPFASRY
jgi:urease accessory protein